MKHWQPEKKVSLRRCRRRQRGKSPHTASRETRLVVSRIQRGNMIDTEVVLRMPAAYRRRRASATGRFIGLATVIVQAGRHSMTRCV